jgi:hypothetical protein
VNKDKTLRLCVDYRQLNNITKKDSYALPRIEELLDCLGGSTFFSVIDMKSGYHQVEIFEPHKERSAFTVGPLGFYEYTRMPFGMTNSPATYQRLMEDCLGPTNFTFRLKNEHFFGASFKLACCIRSITRRKLLRCSSYVFPKIITSSMKTQQIRRW